jgi:hypothetical protein
MNGSRVTLVLTVLTTTRPDGTPRFEIDFSGSGWSCSPFAASDALREPESESDSLSPHAVPEIEPRNHIESQSLQNLKEAAHRMRLRGMRVSEDLILERWRDWVSSRPDSSQWGAAQRMRSARRIHEWVKELIR